MCPYQGCICPDIPNDIRRYCLRGLICFGLENPYLYRHSSSQLSCGCYQTALIKNGCVVGIVHGIVHQVFLYCLSRAPRRSSSTRLFKKMFIGALSLAARSNLNVEVNHNIMLVFRVQALWRRVALVDMPNSVLLLEFQTASGGHWTTR